MQATNGLWLLPIPSSPISSWPLLASSWWSLGVISRGCCCFKLLLFGFEELLCWALLLLCNCCLWNCFCCCVLIDGDLTNVGMWHCMESCDLKVLDMDFRFPPRGDRILFELLDVDGVAVVLVAVVFVLLVVLLFILLLLWWRGVVLVEN